MGFFKRLLPFLLLFSIYFLPTVGCEKDRKRPIGFHRLGPIEQFLAPMTELPEQRLILRRDEQGLSAMSTQCTYDLDTLKKREAHGVPVWACELCGSEFSESGAVLKGPAEIALPYYSMVEKEGTIGGAKDTLYVRVGDEVPQGWRLRIVVVEDGG